MPDSPITLEEYDPVEFSRDELPETVSEELWEEHGSKIDVEFPTRKTRGKWILKNKGYAGRIIIDSNWEFQLEPKTSVNTILGMLKYAYSLESFDFQNRLYNADSLTEFFDGLAFMLAKGVLKRQQQGLHKNYVKREKQMSTVKGRIDFNKTTRRPWEAKPHVSYREITADIDDNQILLWTLEKILSSDAPSEPTMQTVRRAYRPMASGVSLKSITAEDCTGREYRRLNQDYEQLHALCHLILDTTIPTRNAGNKRMLPFIVDMARLYESFVAEWLSGHLPSGYSVQEQEHVDIGDSGRQYDVDLVFYFGSNAVAIADTKYKVPSEPATGDISQVVAYAEAKGVQNAFLIYPETLENPINTQVGGIDVGTLTFGLEDDLQIEGERFLTDFNREVIMSYGLSPVTS